MIDHANQIRWPVGLAYSDAVNGAVSSLAGLWPGAEQCSVVLIRPQQFSVISRGPEFRHLACHPVEPLLATVQADRVLVLGLPGGEPLQSIDIRGDVQSISWDPTGTRLAVACRRNSSQSYGILIVDVATQAAETLISLPGRDCVDVAFPPRGRRIAFCARERHRSPDAAGSVLALVDSRSGHFAELALPYGAVSEPTWSPSGDRIAGIGRSVGYTHWSDNRTAFVCVFDRDGRMRISGVSPPSLNAGKRAPHSRSLGWLAGSLLFIAPERGCLRIWRALLDGLGRHDPAIVSRPSDSHVLNFCTSADGRVVYWDAWLDQLPALRRTGRITDEDQLSGSTRPEELYRSPEMPGRSPQLVVRRVETAAADEVRTESFVVHGPARKRGPLLVDLHGGPHGFHPVPSLPGLLLPRLLADEGWTTVLPNPRGSTSYGIEFQQKIVGDWAGGDVRDIRAVIDSFVGRADLSAICLMGWSYGGYLAAWLACHVSELNAVIIGAPMTDLMLMESTTDIPEYCHYELGGPPGTRPEVYEARSPVNQIGDRMPRILLLHAAFDRRCPPLQSTLFSRRLAGRGQAVSLVVLPTDDHLLSGMHWWAERLRRTFGWLMSAVGQK